MYAVGRRALRPAFLVGQAGFAGGTGDIVAALAGKLKQFGKIMRDGEK